jgi:uracil-DNA glycosylase family 4
MPNHQFDDPLNETAESFSSTKVPNQKPKITNVPYRLAIIGEAPGKDEAEQGKPFVGFSGKELDKFLSRYNILREACFIGNICQVRPMANKIATFEWKGDEIQGGLQVLQRELSEFKPNVILLLGGSAFHAFKNPHLVPGRAKSKKETLFKFPESISDWRGSFFYAHGESPAPGVKCIASYHPAFCLRSYEYTPMLMMDIGRAYADAKFPEIIHPKRNIHVEYSYERVIEHLDWTITNKPKIGADIEGWWNAWSCISFAKSPEDVYIVPFTNMDGSNLWSEEEEYQIFKRVVQILSDPLTPKVWQNGLYDRWATQYGYGIVTRGRSDDIMLKHWELYCELEKGLSVQTSIYTKESYYKSDRQTNDRETFWTYCCKDSAVTIEIDGRVDKMLQPSSRKHYEFNNTVLNALLYIELRGIKYNHEEAKKRSIEVERSICELQYELDLAASMVSEEPFGLPITSKQMLRALVRDVMCYKRDSSIVKEDFKDVFPICMSMLEGDSPLEKWQKGFLSIALKLNLNIKGGALKTYLYTSLGLPEQLDPKTESVTTDYEALITLRKKFPQYEKELTLIIDIGELRTRYQMLQITTDPDGRVRAGYNIVGSETGRVTCYTSPTGSGYSLQTIPDENELKPVGHHLRNGMRDLLTADPDCYIAKCDLKGADGWTIGANLAALGDSTMLDDLRYGLKPAQILCFASRHGAASISGKSREQLSELCKEVKKSDWDYFAGKQCIWGFCYGMGVRKAVQHVFNVSEGTVLTSEADMQKLKDMLFKRYGIERWHKACQEKINRQPYPPQMITPSGQIRKFFGRKADVLGEWLATEPQIVTTFATNSAMYNLWMDPENRYKENGRTKLIVEPIHQVHDEMVIQFRKEHLDFTLRKVRQWFNNPITIAGIQLTIPYDGSYGTNWAMNEHSKVGSI